MTKQKLPRGLWFDIDGIDGAGKTTLVSLLHRFFCGLDDSVKMEFKKHPIVHTKEPTYITEAGQNIRRILQTDSNPVENGELLLNLYFEDRKIHQDKLITPALEQRCLVINDRGELSSFAYQWEQLKQAEIDQEKAFDMIFERSQKVKRPSFYIVIDTPADIAIERMRREGRGTQKFEKDLAFLEKVRKNYLELQVKLPKEKYNIKVISGNQQKEQVFQQALAYFKGEYYKR